MRQLTITRRKSFVGSISKLNVYIEDPTSNEIVINETPCRKLGQLKNGETATFEVGEWPAKVFVIADRLSKNFCNDVYVLPAGPYPLVLSGACKFNPVLGNAFCFDNNPHPIAAENRKRSIRKGVAILAIAIIVGVVVGYLGAAAMFRAPREYTAGAMTITLPRKFTYADDSLRQSLQENMYDENIVLVESMNTQKMLIVVTKESVPDATFSLKDYAEAYQQIQGPDAELTEKNGIPVVICNTDAGEAGSFVHFNYLYKHGDDYWRVTFTVNARDAEQLADQTAEYAASVTFE